jgi:hypothetical protein
MKKIFLAAFLVLFHPLLFANGSMNVNSELSHLAGGAIMAGTIVTLTDNYWPEQNRAWVGFTVSSALGALSQYYEYANGSNDFNNAFMDAASHALGSAIGAYISDQYLLMPVINKSADETYVGLSIQFQL